MLLPRLHSADDKTEARGGRVAHRITKQIRVGLSFKSSWVSLGDYVGSHRFPAECSGFVLQ